MKFPNFTVQFDDCSIEESKSMFIRPIEKVRLYALKPTTNSPKHIIILHRTTYSPSNSTSTTFTSKNPVIPISFPYCSLHNQVTCNQLFFSVFCSKKNKKKNSKKKIPNKKKNLDQNHLLQNILTIQPTHLPLLHSIIHIERSY